MPCEPLPDCMLVIICVIFYALVCNLVSPRPLPVCLVCCSVFGFGLCSVSLARVPGLGASLPVGQRHGHGAAMVGPTVVALICTFGSANDLAKQPRSCSSSLSRLMCLCGNTHTGVSRVSENSARSRCCFKGVHVLFECIEWISLCLSSRVGFAHCRRSPPQELPLSFYHFISYVSIICEKEINNECVPPQTTPRQRNFR